MRNEYCTPLFWRLVVFYTINITWRNIRLQYSEYKRLRICALIEHTNPSFDQLSNGPEYWFDQRVLRRNLFQHNYPSRIFLAILSLYISSNRFLRIIVSITFIIRIEFRFEIIFIINFPLYRPTDRFRNKRNIF